MFISRDQTQFICQFAPAQELNENTYSQNYKQLFIDSLQTDRM